MLVFYEQSLALYAALIINVCIAIKGRFFLCRNDICFFEVSKVLATKILAAKNTK